MKEQQATQLLHEATMRLEKIRNIENKIAFMRQTSTLEQYNEIYGNQNMVSATKILEGDSSKVALNKLMLEGYHILSEIGSWVGNRNSTNYTVIVTSNLEGANAKFSWNELTFEQFAGMVDFSGIGEYGYSGSKLVLKDTASLFAEFGNSSQEWGNQRSQMYEAFDRAVRELTVDDKGNLLTWKKTKRNKNKKFKWENVKRGNTLEAFLRYEQLLKDDSLTEQQRLYIAMEDTMKKPAPFYQGGDIGDTQIKGDYATIAQVATIENHLKSVRGMLQRLINQLQSIQLTGEQSASIGQNISTNISNAIEKEIDKLMKEFISNTIRQLT